MNLRALTAYAGVATIVIAPAAAQQVRYDTRTLDNGLRVVLVEDHSAPVVTVDLWYAVGSADEVRGRTGFAHLFEHMMFQGSANLEKDEHGSLVERAGGLINASTMSDATNYFQVLPANRLNLGLWLEAERMRNLSVTPEALDNQREAVKEERRQRIDNQPYFPAVLDAMGAPFDEGGCFAYAHPNIGLMEDLDAANIGDVRAFFDRHYVPNNATLTIVGDFDPDDAMQLVRNYFGEIPRGPEHTDPTCAWSKGAEPRTVEWEDPLATLPAVLATFAVPAHDHADTPAIEILSQILGTGETSRFNQSLVREQQVALQVQALSNSQRLAGAVIILGIANQGVAADSLAGSIHAAIARVLENGVTEEELGTAKNRLRATRVMGQQTTMQVAEHVQHFVHLHDDLAEINSDLDRYLAVTANDVLRVARAYLTPENRITYLVVPAAGGERPVP
jgi:predicted Zn-dependent peptidase